jgi:hypothetical protein
MQIKYIILSTLIIFFAIILANSFFNRIVEGKTSKRPVTSKRPATSTSPPDLPVGRNSLIGEIYSVVCRDDNYKVGDTIDQTKTDGLINAAIDNYITNTTALLIQYVTNLTALLNKFNNITTALKIGNIELISPQTQPMVTITPPIDNNIYQTLNFLIPKGNKGETGKTPTDLVRGPTGNKGYMGETGPSGIYAVIEQEKPLN